MEARELRIGNYFYDIFDVKNPEVRKWTVEDFVTCINYQSSKHPITFAKPIPLTEEWLEKLGFEVIDAFDSEGIEDHYYLLKKNTISFCCLRPFETIEIDFFDGLELRKTPIKHVHQLQNLYFALTGEELQHNHP